MHEFKTGTMLTIELDAVLPVFIDVNEGTLPLPLAANPMAELLLVQLKAAPEGLLVKAVKGTTSPLQKTWLEIGKIIGLGFMLMVKFCAIPIQLLICGTTVMTATIELFVPLLATKDGIFPLPAEGNPMPILLLLHENVAPAGILENEATDAILPSQKLSADGVLTTGPG
jgi:hypothetical protein